jgi:hypothetical protein
MLDEPLMVSSDLKRSDLRNYELNWLSRCFRDELREKITESRIAFLDEEIYLICHPSKNIRKNMPSRFLENDLFINSIRDIKLHNGLFVKINLLYWYFHNVIDVWSFKTTKNSLFNEVFLGDNVEYEEVKKGYRVLDVHLEKVRQDWTPIEKTLFIGYLQFLNLLEDETVPHLIDVIEEIKKGTMKDYGLVKGIKKSFTKTR